MELTEKPHAKMDGRVKRQALQPAAAANITVEVVEAVLHPGVKPGKVQRIECVITGEVPQFVTDDRCNFLFIHKRRIAEREIEGVAGKPFALLDLHRACGDVEALEQAHHNIIRDDRLPALCKLPHPAPQFRRIVFAHGGAVHLHILRLKQGETFFQQEEALQHHNQQGANHQQNEEHQLDV